MVLASTLLLAVTSACTAGDPGASAPAVRRLNNVELTETNALYDLQADPPELCNLLPDQAPAGVREERSARLDRLLSRPTVKKSP